MKPAPPVTSTRDVAARFGELNIGTPGALVQRLRDLGGGLDIPALWRPMGFIKELTFVLGSTRTVQKLN